jgi:putative ABC transport system permease protein
MRLDYPIDIGWFDLATAAALLLIVLALSAWQRLDLGRQVVVGAIRATVQLVLIGHVLL